MDVIKWKSLEVFHLQYFARKFTAKPITPFLFSTFEDVNNSLELFLTYVKLATYLLTSSQQYFDFTTYLSAGFIYFVFLLLRIFGDKLPKTTIYLSRFQIPEDYINKITSFTTFFYVELVFLGRVEIKHVTS